MRHGKKNNHLGRTASHRKALLSNLASSLILNKRIVTTVAKAKELRKYVEPLLTKSKEDTTHNRRIVFSYLQNKDVIKALFGEISEKIANRNGGYTRIIKLGTRQGDAAETAMIELVDYNELLLTSSEAAPAKTRRSRRSGGSKSTTSTGAVASSAEVAETNSPESADVATPEVSNSVADSGVETQVENTAPELPSDSNESEGPLEDDGTKPEA